MINQMMLANAMRQPQQKLAQAPTSGQTSLVGNRQLPVDGRSIIDLGRGNYDVQYGGQSVGRLSRGGPNGRFTPSGNVPIPQPLMQQSQTPMAMQLGGGGMGQQLGGMQQAPQRQYAPNPFQQQQQQAQMLRRPIMTQAPTMANGGGFRG